MSVIGSMRDPDCSSLAVSSEREREREREREGERERCRRVLHVQLLS